MNAKIAVFVIFVEAITYLLLYNLHGSTFQLFVTFITERWSQSVQVPKDFVPVKP